MSSIFCLRCKVIQTTIQRILDLEIFNIHGDFRRMDCSVCQHFLAVSINDKVINIDEVVDGSVEDGWRMVRTNSEKIIFYVLSQIVYPEIDTPRKDKYECFYDFANDGDHVILRWFSGKPIGFYTVRPRGTEIFANANKYSMNTVDTAYIRSQYRNQGIGIEIVYDVVARFQDQDIGFSKPISEGMFRVLKRFLMEHKEYRLRFWEIEDGGIEGYAKLVWYVLRKQLKT